MSRAARATVRLRFREGREFSLPNPWFNETDAQKLLGRAMAHAWWSASEDARLQTDTTAALFVEAQGPDIQTWTVVGRFLFADLLGGFAPERWQRLLETANRLLRQAKTLARQRFQVEH
jgi:hypothetical protein